MLDTKKPSFCQDLKDARINAGLSGAELSRRIGINEGMVRRYENPERSDHVKPGDVTLKKLNDLLAALNDPRSSGVGPLVKVGDSPQKNPKTTTNGDQAIADALPLEVLISAIKKRGGVVSFA